MKTKSYWNSWTDTWNWSSVYVHKTSTFQSWLILFWAWVVLSNPEHIGQWAGHVVKSFKLATAM